MDMQTGRARFPARVTVQMTKDLKNRLQELARRDYGGDLQALLRETLQARVDEPGDGQAEMSEVLRVLDQVRQDAAERNRETGAQLERLLDVAVELRGVLSLQASDTMGILDRVEKVRGELAEMNRTRRIERALRESSGSESDR